MWAVAGGDKCGCPGRRQRGYPRTAALVNKGDGYQFSSHLGENRRELGEIEAFWNERSRFPEGARCPRPLPSSRVAYNAAAVPEARSASRGRHTRFQRPPTHAYGNSSACTHGTCTCTCRSRNRMECICVYVCAVALSTRERGASEKPAPVAYESRGRRTRCAFSVLG